MTRQHVPTQTNSYNSQRSRLLYTHKKLKKNGQQVHVLMYAVSCGREVQCLSEVFWIKSYIKLLLFLFFFGGGGWKGREGTVWQLKSLKPHVSVKQYVTFSQRSHRNYRHIDDSLDWGRNYHMCILSICHFHSKILRNTQYTGHVFIHYAWHWAPSTNVAW